MTLQLISLAVAYILGAVPFGYVIVRLTSGQDVRGGGSGSSGATNGTRTSGLKAGALTYLLDVAQGVAAARASENKIHAHPARVGSLPPSANKEDHVSMGVTAALKADHVLKNIKNILSIELLASRLALEYHKPLKPGKGVKGIYDALAKVTEPLERDRALYEEFE